MKKQAPVIRAPPRRRKESNDDHPLFLRKAYDMITSCPSSIGGWSENGDTFIICDVERFARDIIPTMYKHNKFSSFVRQLNFYGFRKIRAQTAESAIWEFKHPDFRRGEPHLLTNIKRCVHFAAPSHTDSSDTSDVKNHINNLYERMASLDAVLTNLTEMVTHNAPQPTPLTTNSDSTSKKRKVSQAQQQQGESMTVTMIHQQEQASFGWLNYDASFPARSDSDGMSNSLEPTLEDYYDADDQFALLLDDFAHEESALEMDEEEEGEHEHAKEEKRPQPENIVTQQLVTPISNSNPSFSSQDNVNAIDRLADMLSTFSLTASSPDSTRSTPLSAQVADVIATLPSSLQERFVDRLADIMASKLITTPIAAEPASALAVKMEFGQACAPPSDRPLVTSLPSAQAMSPVLAVYGQTFVAEAQPSLSTHMHGTLGGAQRADDGQCPCFYCRQHPQSGVATPNPAIAYPLASAAIGAFVTQYNAALSGGVVGVAADIQNEISVTRASLTSQQDIVG